jgi:hypothetical protein
MTDGRCKFGPRAKREMIARLLAGEKARAIARDMGSSPTTVRRTRDRWKQASVDERAAFAGDEVVPMGAEDRGRAGILDAHAKTNWEPMRLAALTGRHGAAPLINGVSTCAR